MLIAYDADGNVIATLDYMVAVDDDGTPIGFVDFEAQEPNKLRPVWEVEGAAGSGTWPEYLGARAHAFRVELDDDKRIVALVHKVSRVKRRRDKVTEVGSQTRPLALDDSGRTAERQSSGTRLPIR